VSWLVLAGILITFGTAIVGAVASLGNRKRINEVHVLVNSQLHTVLNRVDQLVGVLRAADVDVPDPPA
jgi:hypothetical protein